MKVLVIWKVYFNYLDGIAYAFDNLPGVDGCSLAVEQFTNKARFYERLFTRKGIIYFKDKYISDIVRDLVEECNKYNPELILFLNADESYKDILENGFFDFIVANKIKSAVWFVDSMRNMQYTKEYLQKFDALYSFENADLDYAKQKYSITNMKYLPLGADTNAYKYDPAKQSHKKYDLCFVGGPDPKRLNLLEKIAEFCSKNNRKMVVFGYLWKHRPMWRRMRHERMFKKAYPTLHKYVVNKQMNPKDLSNLYNESKICLNIIRSVHNGANPRTFEILATQSFQMVDYSEPIKVLLEDKKHLVMYKNLEELEQLVEYYLEHDDEREKIAQAGYDLVMEKYTLVKLVAQIVKDMEEKI